MRFVATAYDLESALQNAIALGVDEHYEEGGMVEEAEEKKTVNLPCKNAPRDGRRNKCTRARRERRQNKTVPAEPAPEEDAACKEVAWKRRKIIAQTAGCIVTSAGDKEQEFKAAEGGWVGTREKQGKPCEENLQGLLARGFELVKWDGRGPKAIVDQSGRVVVVLAGMPKKPFEEEVVAGVTAAFQAEGEGLPPRVDHSRGGFHAVLAGFSHGGGTQQPTETSTASMYTRARKTLTSHPAVIRLAGFQNQAFKTYFPQTHAYYRSTMSQMKKEDPSLQSPFVDTFPSAALNLGPQTVCKPHKDFRNLSFGICSITALGTFDPTKGGHLVLEELGLVVEFPPGSTVLIPSAFITHSNLRIGKDEKRYSFTQYAAGSIFSYVENGMKTDKAVLKKGTGEEKLRWKASRETRWQKGLSMFPMISSYK